MRLTVFMIVLALLAGGLMAAGPARAEEPKKTEKKVEKKAEKKEEPKEESEQDVDPKELPKGVLEAAKKLFPDAEVDGAAKEKDGDRTVYEVEFKLKGMTIDVMLSEKGVVELVEKQIAVKSVPEAVSKAVEEKYPKSTIKLAEELYKIVEGKQKLDVYEVLIETADKKGVEIKLSPQGKITEEEQKGAKKDKDDDDDKDAKKEKKEPKK